MSLILGIIFKDMIPLHLLTKKQHNHQDDTYGIYNLGYKDGTYFYKQQSFIDKIISFFDRDFWFSILIIAPAIIFHELAHKIVAQSFGMSSTFYAAYNFLVFALVMKLVFPYFVFFVPGYVSSNCVEASKYCIPVAGSEFAPSPIARAGISIAGPLSNLIIWIIAVILLKIYFSDEKSQNYKNRNFLFALIFIKRLNLFLFILNLLPIPGFDGFNFFSSIFEIFF